MKVKVGQKYERVSGVMSWYTIGDIYEVYKVRDNGIGETIDDEGEIGVISPNHEDRWLLVSE